MNGEAAIALEDVRDVRGFAISQGVMKTPLGGADRTPAEREEAIQEAIAIIFELHGDWTPSRCAKFSAYLISMLPKRLVSWYRVELRQSGRGRWSGSTGEYRYNGMVSIDAMAEEAEVTTGSRHPEGKGSQSDRSVNDSALTTHGAEDEADGEALDELLAEVSGAPA